MRDLQTFDVELSVGIKLCLSQSNWRIARKRDRMEAEANENPLPDVDDQSFAVNFYPLLAAAVVSDNCPSLEECLQSMPEEDLELWYQTAKKANPKWFVYLDSVSELIRQSEESSDMETKKEQNPSSTDEEKIQEG